MALVDALLPYLEEEERKKRLQASEEGSPAATAEFARALIGKGPKPPVKPAPGETPPPPPEAIVEEPPTLRSRNYAVPEPALPASPVMTPEGEAGLAAASVNPEPNLRMPDFSGATAGPVTGGTPDAYDQYMIENQRLHGTSEHKGWGNRFKHALQGMGVGALVSIGDAWKASGGKGQLADLLGAGAGGAAGGGAASIYSPKAADRLYNKFFVEPEAEKQAEKARIARKEAIEQKKDELGIDKLAQDIERSKAELLEMPDERERKKKEIEIKQKMLELDERRVAVSERPDPDWRYEESTGERWNQRTGAVEKVRDPYPKAPTGGPNYYPGSTDMQRVRSIAEEEVKALPNNAGNVEWVAQTSADADTGGIERKLAGIFLGDANLAKQTVDEWRNYQKPAAPLVPPPATASDQEKAAYQEKVKAAVSGGDSADKTRRAEVSKYVDEARKQLLDEKRRGAELNYRRMVEERVQQFLQQNYNAGTPPAAGGNDRTQGSLPGYGKGKGKGTKKNLGTEDERAYDPDYGKIGLK